MRPAKSELPVMASEKFMATWRRLSQVYAGQINDCMAGIEAGLVVVPVDLGAIRLAAHTLAGSAVTFGYQEVGLAAAALEDFLTPLIARGSMLSPSENERLQTLVGRLRLAAAHA